MDKHDLHLLQRQPGFVLQVRAPIINVGEHTGWMSDNLKPVQVGLPLMPVAQPVHDQRHKPTDTVVFPFACVIEDPRLIQHEMDKTSQMCDTFSPVKVLPVVGQPSHTIPGNVPQNVFPAMGKQLLQNTPEKMPVNVLPITGQLQQNNPGNFPVIMHPSVAHPMQHNVGSIPASIPINLFPALGQSQHPVEYTPGDHTGKVPVPIGQHLLQVIRRKPPDELRPAMKQQMPQDKHIAETSLSTTRVCPVHPHRGKILYRQQPAGEHHMDHPSHSIQPFVKDAHEGVSMHPANNMRHSALNQVNGCVSNELSPRGGNIAPSCQPDRRESSSSTRGSPVADSAETVQQSLPRPPALIPIGYLPQEYIRKANEIEAINGSHPLVTDVPPSKHVHIKDDIQNEHTVPSGLRPCLTLGSNPTGYSKSVPATSVDNSQDYVCHSSESKTTKYVRPVSSGGRCVETNIQTVKLPRARKHSIANVRSSVPNPTVSDAQNVHTLPHLVAGADLAIQTGSQKQRRHVYNAKTCVTKNADTIQCQSRTSQQITPECDATTRAKIESMRFDELTSECVANVFRSLKDATSEVQGKTTSVQTVLECPQVLSTETHSLTVHNTTQSKANQTYPKADVCTDKQHCDVTHNNIQQDNPDTQRKSRTQIYRSMDGASSARGNDAEMSENHVMISATPEAAGQLAGEPINKTARASPGKVLKTNNNKKEFVMTTIEEMSPVQYFENHDELAALKKISNEPPVVSIAETSTATDATPGVCVSKSSDIASISSSSAVQTSATDGSKDNDPVVKSDSMLQPALLQKSITETDDSGAAYTLKFSSRENHEVSTTLDGHTMPPNVTIVRESPNRALINKERTSEPDLIKVHEYCKSYIRSVNDIATPKHSRSVDTSLPATRTASKVDPQPVTNFTKSCPVAHQTELSGPNTSTLAQQRDFLPEYPRIQRSAGASSRTSTSSRSQQVPVRLYTAWPKPDLILYPNGEMKPFKRTLQAKLKHKIASESSEKQSNIKRKKSEDRAKVARKGDKLGAHSSDPKISPKAESGHTKSPAGAEMPRDIPIAMSQFGSVVTLKCSNCENAATFMCSQCRKVGYCSLECQKTSWTKSHKMLCGRSTAFS